MVGPLQVFKTILILVDKAGALLYPTSVASNR